MRSVPIRLSNLHHSSFNHKTSSDLRILARFLGSSIYFCDVTIVLVFSTFLICTDHFSRIQDPVCDNSLTNGIESLTYFFNYMSLFSLMMLPIVIKKGKGLRILKYLLSFLYRECRCGVFIVNNADWLSVLISYTSYQFSWPICR